MNNEVELINLYKKLESLPKIKKCLYPDKEHCKGKIKRAHTIQNNKILISVSDNGNLIKWQNNSRISRL